MIFLHDASIAGRKTKRCNSAPAKASDGVIEAMLLLPGWPKLGIETTAISLQDAATIGLQLVVLHKLRLCDKARVGFDRHSDVQPGRSTRTFKQPVEECQIGLVARQQMGCRAVVNMRLDAVINERLAVVVVNLSLSAAQCQSVTAENLLMKCYAKRPGGHQGTVFFGERRLA